MENEEIFDEIPVSYDCGHNKGRAHILKLHHYKSLITIQYPNIKRNPVQKYLHRNRDPPMHQPCIQRPVVIGPGPVFISPLTTIVTFVPTAQ